MIIVSNTPITIPNKMLLESNDIYFPFKFHYYQNIPIMILRISIMSRTLTIPSLLVSP